VGAVAGPSGEGKRAHPAAGTCPARATLHLPPSHSLTQPVLSSAMPAPRSPSVWCDLLPYMRGELDQRLRTVRVWLCPAGRQDVQGGDRWGRLRAQAGKESAHTPQPGRAQRGPPSTLLPLTHPTSAFLRHACPTQPQCAISPSALHAMSRSARGHPALAPSARLASTCRPTRRAARRPRCAAQAAWTTTASPRRAALSASAPSRPSPRAAAALCPARTARAARPAPAVSPGVLFAWGGGDMVLAQAHAPDARTMPRTAAALCEPHVRAPQRH
jgi:hypothetical protein